MNVMEEIFEIRSCMRGEGVMHIAHIGSWFANDVVKIFLQCNKNLNRSYMMNTSVFDKFKLNKNKTHQFKISHLKRVVIYVRKWAWNLAKRHQHIALGGILSHRSPLSSRTIAQKI